MDSATVVCSDAGSVANAGSSNISITSTVTDTRLCCRPGVPRPPDLKHLVADSVLTIPAAMGESPSLLSITPQTHVHDTAMLGSSKSGSRAHPILVVTVTITGHFIWNWNPNDDFAWYITCNINSSSSFTGLVPQSRCNALFLRR
jgi:hypothetical protein